jgi:CBS-domain-containing membrane protein
MIMLAKLVATRPMALRLSTAAELMRREPLSFDRTTPVLKAAALLAEHDLDAAPVVSATRRLQGIVTKASCAAWQEFCARSSPLGFASVDLDATTVEEIMSPLVATVLESDSFRLVIDKLAEERLRRVYVVDDEGRLAGVVSTSEVLRRLLAGGSRRRVFRADASAFY